MVATNAQSRRACKLFKELEGIDIYPAPGVALATLIKMVDAGTIDKDACIMLNITGAGEEAAKQNRELFHLKPSKVFSLNAEVDDVVTYVESLF
jgi:cysteate synthase